MFLDNIHKRLKYAREKKGYTQEELAKMLGLNDRVAISRWEGGSRTPRLITAKKLSEILDVDISWLLSGEGSMDVAKYDELDIYKRRDFMPLGEIVRLREISHVAAGTFASLLTIDDEPIMHAVPVSLLPSKVRSLSPAEISRKYFVFIVKGNSMYPRIHEGDQLIVERVESFEQVFPGNIIIAINCDNEIIVKRLKKKNSRFVLESDNPEYSDIEMKLEISAVGKVIKIMADA